MTLTTEQHNRITDLYKKQKKIEHRMGSEQLSDATFKRLDQQWDRIERQKKAIMDGTK